MKKGIFILIIILLLFSCEVNDEARIYYDENIEGVLFDTNGGGDIQFQISRNENNFIIEVNRYRFSDINEEFTLSSSEYDVFNLISKIFNKELDLYDEVYEATGETGTWTDATLHYVGEKIVNITNITISGDLNILYTYVENAINE